VYQTPGGRVVEVDEAGAKTSRVDAILLDVIHEREQCRRVALGLQHPTLLLKGGSVYSPFTGEFFEADVAVCGTLVAGVGSYPGPAGRVIDVSGSFVSPGFIDAHVHPETSLLSPPRFAEALALHGTTTTVSEPHELVNVIGRAGMDFYLAARTGLPVDLRLMVPTMVPASPFEKASGILTHEDVAQLLAQDGVIGLGEAMDYLGLIAGKASPALDSRDRHVVDGHAPDVAGPDLAAYMLAGPISDHETSDPDLLLERRRLGMWTLIREGSAARDLARALPFLVEHGTERTALCTDDRNAAALAEHHHIDGVAGALVRAGVPLNEALRAATINPATLYRLHDRGSVSPGRKADLLVVDDPTFPHPRLVVQQGVVVAENGVLSVPLPATPPLPAAPLHLSLGRASELAPPAPDGPHRARAIHITPRTIVSEDRVVDVQARAGRVAANPDADVALLALLESRGDSLLVGHGLVSGLGIRRGAIATTIAHDAHHLLVTGVSPDDMLLAAQTVATTGGGLAVVDEGRVQTLPLPLGGLMTDLPAPVVGRQLRALEKAVADLGVDFEEPFMVLSFITLSVIPSLRLTLDGLLDVAAQELVPVIVS
jgi:adenine deaminase